MSFPLFYAITCSTILSSLPYSIHPSTPHPSLFYSTSIPLLHIHLYNHPSTLLPYIYSTFIYLLFLAGGGVHSYFFLAVHGAHPLSATRFRHPPPAVTLSCASAVYFFYAVDGLLELCEVMLMGVEFV